MSNLPDSQPGGHSSGAGGNKTIVMIAMDGSENSFHAFDWYLTNMHRAGSEILVANCSDYKDLIWTPVMTTDCAALSNMIQLFEDQTTSTAAQIQDRLANAKVNGKLLRLSGDAGHAIVKAAQEHNANYIVTGSRGLGTVRRTLLGSVSSYIVHHAQCPVLVCQTKNQ